MAVGQEARCRCRQEATAIWCCWIAVLLHYFYKASLCLLCWPNFERTYATEPYAYACSSSTWTSSRLGLTKDSNVFWPSKSLGRNLPPRVEYRPACAAPTDSEATSPANKLKKLTAAPVFSTSRMCTLLYILAPPAASDRYLLCSATRQFTLGRTWHYFTLETLFLLL